MRASVSVGASAVEAERGVRVVDAFSRETGGVPAGSGSTGLVSVEVWIPALGLSL